MKKNGISLITLVVTIVIIIILAAVVILSIMNKDTKENAKWASFVQEMNTVHDAVLLRMQSSADIVIEDEEYKALGIENRFDSEDNVEFTGGVYKLTQANRKEIPKTLLIDILFVRDGGVGNKSDYTDADIEELFTTLAADKDEKAIYIVDGKIVGDKYYTYLYDMKTDTAFKIQQTKIYGQIYHYYEIGSEKPEYDKTEEDYISYDLKGGEGDIPPQPNPRGETITLTEEIPTYPCYIFLGWATSSLAIEADYQPGDEYQKDGPHTLYAVWEEDAEQQCEDNPIEEGDYYTIYYDANGGINAPQEQTKRKGVIARVSSIEPTKTNFSFRGWSTSPGGMLVEYKAGDEISSSSDVRLWAVWDEAHYRVDGQVSTKTFNEALARCNEMGSTIELLDDYIELGSMQVNKSVMFDLNGHTLTRNNEILVVQGNEFTVYGSGAIVNNNGIVIKNEGIFNLGINDGTVDIRPEIIGSSNGVFNTNTFNMYDGRIQGIMAIIGGVADTPAGYKAVSTESNDIQSVALDTVGSSVARIDMKYFSTLQAAVDAATSVNQPIYLLKNIPLTETLQIVNGKNILIDLNGFTISNSGNVVTINNSGYLEIRDGTKAKSGTITNTNMDTIINNATGSIKITSGTYTSTLANKHTIVNNGALEIIDGSFTSDGGNAVLTQGSGTLKISGGTFYVTSSNNDYAAVTINTTGKVEISGSNVNIGTSRYTSESDTYGSYGLLISNVKSDSVFENFKVDRFTNYTSTITVNNVNISALLRNTGNIILNNSRLKRTLKTANAYFISNSGTVTLNDCYSEGYAGDGAQYWNTGRITINGGNFYFKNSNIRSRYGTLNINGAYISNTGTSPLFMLEKRS